MREYVDTESDIEDYPAVSRKNASECRRVRIKAPVSVFALGGYSVKVKLNQRPCERVKVVVTRSDDGLVRCERIALQDSEEYLEAEKARRAKQIPPQGSKIGWKVTRGKKLKTMKGME